MIIVSQDKKEIINFNRVSEIVVNDNRICLTDNLREPMGLDIAVYKTEERAMEVLKEIIKVYKFYKGNSYTIGDRQRLLGEYEYGVYEMPVN